MSYLTQKTVKNYVSFNGVALHSGVNVNVTIKPAIPNFGIVFKRIDLKENNVVYPNFANVTNTSLNTTSYINTWSTYLKDIMNDGKIKKELGKLNITVGDIDETYGDDTKGYITKLFEIDEMCIDNPRLAEQKLNTKLDKFPQKIRLKLRQLRVMKALINAKQDKKMDEFIMKTYYLAAKQNIADGDKNGPFLKVS